MLKELVLGFSLSATISSAADDLKKIDSYHPLKAPSVISYEYESKRSETKALEDILVEKKYLDKADECFEKDTETALKLLQKELAVKETGRLDKKTREKLNDRYDPDFMSELKKEVCKVREERIFILHVTENLEKLHYVKGHGDHLTPDAIAGIELYKRLNTIPNSKVLDHAFLTHLNMSPKERALKLEKVLSEIKKIETGRPTLFANIPEYRLYVLHEGKVVFLEDIAVGEALRKWNTDVQSGAITSARVNPTWYVPSSILPEVRHDKRLKYVAGRFIFEPGPENPLGRVAFPIGTASGELFHDTPHKNIFKMNRRAVSHGCMRLSDAKGLFLKFQSLGWIDPAVDLEMLIGSKKEEKYVGTNVAVKRVAVKVRYLLANAMMTGNGAVAFFPYDVYKKGF